MRPLYSYLSGVSLSAFAMGIQVVLLPWLVVGVLGLGPREVGWVQASVLLPNLVFILLGGRFADQRDGGLWMPLLLLLLALAHTALLLWVQWWPLQLGLVLIYGAALGLCQAFMQPLRDTLLARVANPHHGAMLQKTIVGLSLCYFFFQGLGHLLAGQITRLELTGLLMVQVVALLLAASAYRELGRQTAAAQIPPRVPEAVRNGYWSGVRVVWADAHLRHIIGLIAFNGLVHMGVFIVAVPLLVRDVYGGGAAEFALLQLAFVGGGMLANLALLQRRMVEFPGRSMLFSLLYAGVILLALAAQPTSTGLVLLVLSWGAVAGVSASMSKALVQQLAPAGYRGRVLSVYQLALFGMAPLGALSCGYAVSHWGALLVFKVGGALSIALFALNLCVPGLWQVRQAGADSAPL